MAIDSQTEVLIGRIAFFTGENIAHIEFYLQGLWPKILAICNGNRTEWSPIRSVIIRVITKSDNRAAGVRFVYHEYDYRLNWRTRSLITN